MDEYESIIVHDWKELISRLIHEELNRLTTGLTEEQDEVLRNQLTDEFRFWRRRDSDG